MNIRKQVYGGILVVSLIAMRPASGRAEVSTFLNDLSGFNAVACNLPVVIDFDSIVADTDITGQALQGVTFLAVEAPLIVVRGSDTSTPSGFNPPGNANNRLLPTTGENCLSPGGAVLGPGPDPLVEGDSIRLEFDPPVTAVGFDILEQLADGSLYLVRVYDQGNNLIFSEEVVTPNQTSSSGGSNFYGIVSSEQNISRIEFEDTDNNAVFPDANIGYDTLRIRTSACSPIPAVSEWGLVAMALLALTAGTLVYARRRPAPA